MKQFVHQRLYYNHEPTNSKDTRRQIKLIYRKGTHKGKKKKTRQGKGKFSKFGNKGGGKGGSTVSKLYRKKPRGQGSRR